MMENNEEKRIQRADFELSKLNWGFNVELKKTAWYDYVASSKKGKELMFAIKVVGSSFIGSEDYREYVNRLNSDMTEDDIYKLPIVLMIIDDLSDTPQMCGILGWNYSFPYVCKNLDVWPYKLDYFPYIQDDIKAMMHSGSQKLSNYNISVVKRISFDYPNSDNNKRKAVIIYRQNLAGIYRMMNSGYDCDSPNVCLAFAEENNVLSDELDRDLLDEIKKLYSGVASDNTLLVTGADYRAFKKEIAHSHCSIKYVFEPKFEYIYQLESLRIKSWNPICFNIYLNTESDLKLFDDFAINRYISLSEWDKTVQKYNQIRDTIIPNN